MVITDKLKKLLDRIEPVELIFIPRQDPEHLVGIEPVAGQRVQRIAAVQEFGRQQKADSVFCAYVYAFRERVGSAYGVDLPAMVIFELNLVSVATGSILWQAHYSETQKPLSENAFQIGKFFKRKGRWITAEEMADEALEKCIRSFESDYVGLPRSQ